MTNLYWVGSKVGPPRRSDARIVNDPAPARRNTESSAALSLQLPRPRRSVLNPH